MSRLVIISGYHLAPCYGAALQAIITVVIYAAVYLALPALLTGVAVLSWRLRRHAPRGA